MPKKKRSLKASNIFSSTPVIIDDNFPDLRKDPVFMAKHEKAEKLIAEFGIPEAFKTKPKLKGVKKTKSLKHKV
jgi:hypothetical protein